MSRHRDFQSGQPFPSNVMDAVFEFISTHVSPNFELQVTSTTSIGLAAGTGNDQVSIGIGGQMRYVSTAISATASGAAGPREVWVTTSAISATTEDTSAADYSFALTIAAPGSPPSGLARKAGLAQWNGTQLTQFFPLLPAQQGIVGELKPWVGTEDPVDVRYLLTDGRGVLKSAYPGLWAIGRTATNWGNTPTSGTGAGDSNYFTIPDTRGTVLMTPDNLGTARGAAGRVTAATSTRGVTLGEERHLLLATESGTRAHSVGPAATGISAQTQSTVKSFEDRAYAGGGTLGIMGISGTGSTGPLAVSIADPTHVHNAAAQDAANAHNIMQPTLSVPFIIRAR